MSEAKDRWRVERAWTAVDPHEMCIGPTEAGYTLIKSRRTESVGVGHATNLNYVVERAYADMDERNAKLEAWTPRTFLDHWEEVKTFEEAEPAGEDYKACVHSDILDTCMAHEAEELRGYNFYWVRRKPDAGNDADQERSYVALERLGERTRELEKDLAEANQRADEWKGYLDEAAARLKRSEERVMGLSIERNNLEGLLEKAGQYTETLEKRVKLLDGLLDEALKQLDAFNNLVAESIRARRDGK